MEIKKANWHSDGDSLRLSMPIAKVDREKRIVSGFATLDNIDQHGDIVSSDASAKAFERFRGNIREMHQPLAVGKMVSFRKEKLFDKSTGKEYSGVFVNAYVSKGAQDTWEKVLDGTLSGFSIGGNITKSVDEYNPTLEKSIRVIKEYDLTELSLVDNPANQLSNIVSIEKTVDGTVFKGIATEVQVENVFYDKETDEVYLSTESEFTSPTTNKNLEMIGWVETADTNKSAEISRILDAYKQSKVQPDIAKQVEENQNTEGGVTVAEDTKTTVEETTTEQVAQVEEVTETDLAKSADAPEAPATEEAPKAEAEEAPAAVEEAADISEVEVEETDFAKMFDEMKSFISTEISKTATAEAVSSLASQVDQKIAEVTNKYNELAEVVNNIKSTISGVEKRVDGVEKDTAIRKSSDLDGSDVTIQKTNTKWGGHFLSVRNI